MGKIYHNLVSGTLSADPGSGGTTLNSAAFANLPVVSAPDEMWIILDPDAVNGAPEIVLVTAHTAWNTALTATRAQQASFGGGSARAHPVGTVWVHAVTREDLEQMPHRKVTATGDLIVGTGVNAVGRLAVGTAAQVLHGGTTPTYGPVVTADIQDGAVTSAKIADGTIVSSDLAAAVANLLVPAGTVAHTVASSAPTGWLFHNQTVTDAETLYPALFAVAPTGWRTGTAPNRNLVIPNMADRVIAQAGATSLGSSGGITTAGTVTLTTTEMPAHSHPISDPGHGHTASTTVTVADNTVDRVTRLSSTPPGAYIGLVDSDGNGLSDTGGGAGMAMSFETEHGHAGSTASTTVNNNTTGITTQSQGSGAAFSVRNAHVAFNVIIKAH